MSHDIYAEIINNIISASVEVVTPIYVTIESNSISVTIGGPPVNATIESNAITASINNLVVLSTPHGDITDMPDTAGVVSGHDNRYLRLPSSVALQFPDLVDTKFLTNNGSVLSWANVGIAHGDLSDMPDVGNINEDHDKRYPLRSEWLQNGFPNRVDSSMSFNDGNIRFTINPSNGSFDYFVAGIKYTISSSDVENVNYANLTDTEGDWWIYYDGSTLTATRAPNHAMVEDIFKNKAIVAIVFWDADNNKGQLLEERHGISMSPVTHVFIHETMGTRYATGLALNTIDADQNGNTNSHAQFGVDAGEIWDQDIEHVLNAIGSTIGLQIWYRDTSGWTFTTNAGYSVIKTGTGGEDRLAYDNNGTLTEVSDNKFVLCHVFATNMSHANPVVIVGQAEYATKKLARQGALNEIINILVIENISPELKPIASVIFQTKDTYSNAMRAKIVSTDEGNDYVDFRRDVLNPSFAAAQEHGNLAGLGDDDHPQYLLIDDTWLLPPVDARYYPIGGLPGTPDVGDRYLSIGTANGWTDGYIYEWDGSVWIETIPEEGQMVWIIFELLFYVYFSSDWMEVGEDSYFRIDGSKVMTGDLNLGPNGIVGSGGIDIKPSGDVDDYLKFLTTSGQPIIKAIGGAGLQIESDHATAAVLKLFRSVGKQLTFGQTDADGAYIIGTETLDLLLGNDFDDYFRFQVVGGVPEITTIGNCNLKLTASSGIIDFDDDDLITIGTIDAPAHNISDKLITATIFTSAGINACIDALGVEGGEVYLPEGTYLCNTAIVIDYNNTTLRGAGAGTILDASAGQSSPAVIDTNDKDNITIQNLTIIGSAGSGVTSALIGDGDIANFLTVKNCKLRLGDNVGINNNGSDSKIMNNYFDHMDGTSVYLDANGQRDLVEGNYFDDGSIQLNLVGGDYVKIVNNYFQDSSAQAILAGGVLNSIFSGNTINNCDRGINIAGGSNGNIISNNKIFYTASGDYDIYIQEDYNIIVNNSCYGNGTSDKGIYLNEADYCIVSGNFTGFHDIAGIQEDANCQNNLIYGNQCQDTIPYVINGTAHETFYQYGDLSLEFGDLVSEQNPDAVDAIRIKGTGSDVDVVLGDVTGYFSVWNVADNNAVFYVNNDGDTDIAGNFTTTGTITGEQITSTDDIAVPQTGKFQFEGTAGDTHMVFDGTSIQVTVNNVLVWEFN